MFGNDKENKPGACSFESDEDLDCFDRISIDFKQWQFCVIQSVFVLNDSETILELSTNDGLTGTLHVYSPWNFVDLKEGDNVAILAKETTGGHFIVDGNNGFLVLRPQTALSGTLIVSALVCQRKAVLSQFFQSIEKGNVPMTMGSLIHSYFQNAIYDAFVNQESPSYDSILNKLIESDEFISICFENSLNEKEIALQLKKCTSQIQKFIDNYMVSKSGYLQDQQNKNVRITSQQNVTKIHEIVDIEEFVCSPRLGLKGKVDVTVKINNRANHVYPFELKTGKSAFSTSHKAQVLIYIAIMQDLGMPVDRGLLFYLRDNQMFEIDNSPRELRDLIVLRNDLIASIHKYTNITEEQVSFVLPPSITRDQICKNCEHKTHCFALQRRLNNYPNTEPPLIAETLAHLSNYDLDYFFKWLEIVHLESLESRENQAVNGFEVNLVEVSSDPDASMYLHEFQMSKGTSSLDTGFVTGDYIEVQSRNQQSRFPGYIVDVVGIKLIAKLSVNIRKVLQQNTFYVKRNENSSFFLKLSCTNLSSFLLNDESARRMRQIISNKVRPNFSETLDTFPLLFANLNKGQKEAAIKSFYCTNFMLINGFPGTGKTETILAIVNVHLLHGQSVIITSHTNSAVDNVLIKLKQRGVPLLRLGKMSKTSSSLMDCTESMLSKKYKSVEELVNHYNSYNVIGVTCYGADHPLFDRRTFDVCIVDEATQITQPAVLRILTKANKFILIGDPAQLPPVLKSMKAKELGGEESLFTMLSKHNPASSLSIQYRMNGCIMNVANLLTYNGRLQCASKALYNRVFQPSMDTFPKIWMREIFSSRLNDSFVIIDTGNTFDPQQKDEHSKSPTKSYSNVFEMNLVVEILEGFLQQHVSPEDIGIIAPFKQQVRLIESTTKQTKSMDSVEVNTIDQYQGRDKRVIIYSATKSNNQNAQLKKPDQKPIEILDDHRRLNVAITRAKEKFVMVADVTSLMENPPFSKLFDLYGFDCIIRFPK